MHIASYIIHQQAVVEGLVSVVQVLQVQVLGHGVRAAAQVTHAALHLALQRSHRGREQTAQTQPVSLTVSEGQGLVPQGIVQDVDTALSRLQRSRVLDIADSTGALEQSIAQVDGRKERLVRSIHGAKYLTTG